MKLLVMYYNAHDLFLHPRIAGELRMPLKKKKKVIKECFTFII